MSFSLLYLDGSEHINENSDRLTADLMLDQAFLCFYPDTKKRNYFLSVVADPPSDPAVSLYRAEILRDFCARPNLLSGFSSALKELLGLHETQQGDRSRLFSLVRGNDAESAYIIACGISEVSSATAVKTLAVLKGLGELLRMYSPQSQGLSSLLRRIQDLTAESAYSELVSFIETGGNLSADDVFEMRVVLDDYARVGTYELTEVIHPIHTEETTGLRKLFAKKPSADSHEGIRVSDRWSKLRNDLLGGALREVAELAYTISKSIYDEFLPLTRELHFYEAAVSYIEAMRTKKLPLCYPSLTINGNAYYCELYDLFLCALYPVADNVVPNDADLSSGGIIITGNNNTGKTVFLRSIGAAQLLAQAGLPVLARTAEVRVRSGVYTLYAAAEKEFTAGNDAGRFEQEVRMLASMLDSIKPSALVLLNELFQTTAYSEGAEGLYHILRYLRSGDAGAEYVAVTHLTDLVELIGDNAVHLHTLDGERQYKLARV
jgi:Mismatch repair ATPase (MutS family)